MPDELVERKARKGTKSCAECRRRKVRCVWASDEAKLCQRCDRRGYECIAQTFYVKPSDGHRVTSRQRIQHLESQLAALSQAVNRIEGKTGVAVEYTPDSLVLGTTGDEIEDDYDDASSESSFTERVVENKPAYISYLFENEWLSLDTGQTEEMPEEHSEKMIARLLDQARPALQKLVPAKHEVAVLAAHGFMWSGHLVMHNQFPAPWLPMESSPQDLLIQHDAVSQPDADVWKLVSWLLSMALMASQVPNEPGSPDTLSQGSKVARFPSLVTNLVERVIISQDRLMGTPLGLAMTLKCVRLHIFLGSFQKGWLQLRRAIAVAELMGIPRIARHRMADLAKYNPMTSEKDIQLQNAYVWEALTGIEKICGTMLNIPIGTDPYGLQNPRPVASGDTVDLQTYLCRMGEIGIRTQYEGLDQNSRGDMGRIYAIALDLDKELKALNSETPASWWTEAREDIEPRHIFHYWQEYISMRIHLPFALYRDPDALYLYSHMACIDSCRTIAKSYLDLRTRLPSQIFCCRLLDLPVFTAISILLLASWSASTAGASAAHHLDPAETEVLSTQVVDLMEEKTGVASGSAKQLGRQGVNTIKGLRQLLKRDRKDSSDTQEVTLTVPLLGKVHVRRKGHDGMGPAAAQSGTPTWPRSLPTPTERFDNPSQPQAPRAGNIGMVAGDGQIPGVPWDPLYWSIDTDLGGILQGAFMGQGFESWYMPGA